jgi:hypothetical protein
MYIAGNYLRNAQQSLSDDGYGHEEENPALPVGELTIVRVPVQQHANDRSGQERGSEIHSTGGNSTEAPCFRLDRTIALCPDELENGDVRSAVRE